MIFINGRFVGKAVTGAQRAAVCLVRELDRMLDDSADLLAGFQMTLLVPPGISRPAWTGQLKCIAVEVCGRLRGNLWEQVDLPIRANRGFLLNLVNAAPLLARRQAVMIFDANVYALPETYTLPFRLWHRTIHKVLQFARTPLITGSEFSRNELARAGFAPERIRVIPLGADHILAEPADGGIVARLGLSAGHYVVMIGAGARHKNMGAVLSLSERYRALGHVCVAVGQRESHIFRGAEAPSPQLPNVLWTGRLSDAQLRGLLEAALCLIFPSSYEGYGLPPVEAMAVGCPVVASDIPVLREVCADGALYAPADDPDAFLARVQSLSDSRSLREEVIERGLNRASQLTWQCSAARLAAVLRALPI